MVKGAESTRQHTIKLVTIPLSVSNANKTSSTQLTTSSLVNSKAGDGSKISNTSRASNKDKEGSFVQSQKELQSNVNLFKKKQAQITRQKSASNHQLSRFPSNNLSNTGNIMSNTMNASITTGNKTTNYNLKTAYIRLNDKSSHHSNNSNSRSTSKNSLKDRPTTNGRVLGLGK